MRFSRKAGAVLLALSLVSLLGACGDDDTGDAADTGESETGEPNGFSVSITAEGISMPDEVVGGIVQVSLDTDLKEAGPSFTRVTPGTTEDDFRKGAAGVVSGQPFPAFFESTAGIEVERSTITLPEGDYFAWAIPDEPEGEEGAEGEGAPEGEAPEGEGEGEGEGPGGPPPEAVVLKAFKVTAGEAGDLPELEDTITARDYSFDVQITGGADEIVFRNEGPEQWHHAEIFGFGDLDPKEVEANLPKLFESGPDSPPPAIFKDFDFDKSEAGSSAVFSPGLGGTTKVKIESGNTYAVVCFISDQTGGPPHAFSKGMINVFKAG